MSVTEKTAPDLITVLDVTPPPADALPPRKGTSVLGIDPSLRGTGIVRWSDQGVRHGVLIKSEGGKSDPLIQSSHRLKGMADAILSVVMSADPCMVSIESRLFFTEDDNSSERRSGVWWAVVNELVSQGIPVITAAPKVVKKWLTTNGNASKDAMIAKSRGLFPDLSTPTSDIADAASLASMCAHLLGWETPWKPGGVRRKYLESAADLSALDLSAI